MRRLKFIQALIASFSFVGFYAENVEAQCAGTRVLHTSGTQQVGCTEVTVTADGSTNTATPPPCAYGPLVIGPNGNGSYTLDFSTPIQGALIDIQTLDNHNGDIEEMVIDVNGSFYPLTSAGSADGCWAHAIVWPPGTIRGPVGGLGSAHDIYVPGPMSSLKITNNWVSGMPVGFSVSVYVCCTSCNTEAGTINSGPIEICQTEPITLPVAEQTFLETDDLLQYILFTSLTNMASTIIATSNSPQFTFDPATMVAGVTYYVAAIAGNNVNGNVDLTDPCLDASNVVAVTWMPIPVVTFFSSVSCLKPGECYDINVFFLGTPPFQLNAEVVQGNNVVATFGGTYTGMDTVEEICLPLNIPFGDITIQATNFADAFCTCG